jgi:hypothetical protein
MEYHNAPQVVPTYDPPQAAFTDGLEIAQPEKQVKIEDHQYYQEVDVVPEEHGSPPISGLRRLAFFLAALIVLLVVGGAVGGGVGGSMAAKAHKDSSQRSFSSTARYVPEYVLFSSKTPITSIILIKILAPYLSQPVSHPAPHPYHLPPHKRPKPQQPQP